MKLLTLEQSIYYHDNEISVADESLIIPKLYKTKSRREARYNFKHVLKRNHGCCEICGIHVPHTLHCHHIIPPCFGGNGSLYNLMGLCPTCHEFLNRMWLSDKSNKTDLYEEIHKGFIEYLTLKQPDLTIANAKIIIKTLSLCGYIYHNGKLSIANYFMIGDGCFINYKKIPRMTEEDLYTFYKLPTSDARLFQISEDELLLYKLTA